MNTNRYTPEIIAKENISFSIPLYQRLFSWKEEQTNGLMYDLKNHFIANENNCTPYYLGMLSCIKSNYGEQYELIDGQQRFTIMMLLAIVLRDYYSEWESFLNNGNRLYFVARNKDNDYLKDRINGNQLIEPNVKMENGIITISNFIRQEFEEDKQRKEFAQNVYKRLSFFFSILPDCYSKNPSSLNKYFEAMNASGKSLEQHEILKVKLMQNEENKEHLTRIWNAVSDMNRHIIKKSNDDTEESYRSKYEGSIRLCRENRFDDAFEKCENSYDIENTDTISEIEAKQYNFTHNVYDNEDKSIISFPEFLMLIIDIYLNLNGSYSFYRQDLLNVFKDNTIDNKQDFYNQMLFYRLIFDYYILRKEGEEQSNKYNIIFKQENPNNPSKKHNRALMQYQSMLYASQTPFYNWLKPLLVELHNEEYNDSLVILNCLKNIDNKLHVIPKSIEMMTFRNIDRYWFWRLDYYLWENRKEYFDSEEDKEIVDEYVFRANRSIEHLHPQNQVHNEEWESEDIHSFGNLAMISQSFNSQQSDDPVTVKFARIKDQAHNHALQSIKMYRMFLDAEGTPAGWTKEIKDKHQKEMYDLLVKSYNIEQD